eukprot:TRINITY_DN3457_c0_g1_i25.p1 TRINITY_DN3457_c0_g1~~TRINITY_DN3457_c0_g1_i25.p1  ORF type:complete len:146 (+),score=11.24 TRINITY_DN3457_c0_g1_i25:115-552(+)
MALESPIPMGFENDKRAKPSPPPPPCPPQPLFFPALIPPGARATLFFPPPPPLPTYRHTTPSGLVSTHTGRKTVWSHLRSRPCTLTTGWVSKCLKRLTALAPSPSHTPPTQQSDRLYCLMSPGQHLDFSFMWFDDEILPYLDNVF